MKRWFIGVAALGWVTVLAQEKPAVAPALAATAPAAVVASTNLPTARAVIDRYVQEAGGKEAFLKHSSVLIKGRTEIGGKDLGGSMTLATAKPNKLALVIDLGGIAMRSGFDGKIGWQLNPLTGPSLMQEKELADMGKQADFFAILHDDKGFKSMENLGKVEFEGEACYKLKLVHLNDSEQTEYYSLKTGLQKGFTGTQESSFGKITATSVNEEHKKFGALLLPSRVTQKMSGLSQTMIVETVEFDTVPESMFEAPPEIKALLKSEPAAKPASDADPKAEKKTAPAKE